MAIQRLYTWTPATESGFLNTELDNIIAAVNAIAAGTTDITAYAKLAGRAGGQTLSGDTAAAGSLTLAATASATPGPLILRGGSGSERMRFDANGLLLVTGMHNVTGNTTTSQTITSGTYTPTLTGVTNVTSSVALACEWMRVGNLVVVAGALAVTPTAAATSSQIDLSLPVASNLVATTDAGGAGAWVGGTTTAVAQILGDATNDRASFQFVSAGAGAQIIFRFTFTYIVR